MSIKTEEIVAAISREYKDVYRHAEFLPEPYCENIANVKAVVLGCDPSNKKGKVFKKAFGIDEGMNYFGGINDNLEKIGLSKADVYVDNLCKNYFAEETSDNKYWKEIADKYWAAYLKDELDKLFPPTTPVLATSDDLLKVLCYKGCYHRTKNEVYYRECLHVKPNENKLGRIVIPFFRHYKYALRKWPNYANYIKQLIQT